MEKLIPSTHMSAKEALQNAIEMEGDPVYALLSLATKHNRERDHSTTFREWHLWGILQLGTRPAS
jgi:hypothetical protein